MNDAHRRGLRGFAVLALGLATGCIEPRLTTPEFYGDEGGVGGMGGSGGFGGSSGTRCLSEDECPIGQYCNIEEADFTGTCIDGCNDDDDCGDQVCDRQINRCEAPPCTGDADCPDGRCDDTGACVDSDCSRIRPCPADREGRLQHCSPEDGLCTPLYVCCEADARCSMALYGACPAGAGQLEAPLTCDPDPCLEAGCTPETEGADCALDEFCNPDTNRCQQGCRLEPGACLGACDPETRECVEPPDDGCQSDDECPVRGERCVDGDCVEGCDLTVPAACGAGLYCDVRTETCRENCADHDDCDGNEACNPANGHCVPSECRDDLGEGGEPNNDAASATVIALEVNADGVRAGSAEGVLCGEDVDVFRVTLAQAERMRVQVIFDENADLNVRLSGEDVGADPIVIATAQSPEELFFPPRNDVRDEATYIITVFPGRADRAGVPYRVAVIAFADEDFCFVDALESNDTPEDATAIGNANPYDVGDLNLCPHGDEDWFTKSVLRNDGLRIEVLTQDDQPPMTIALFSQDRIDSNGAPEYEGVVAEEIAGRTLHTLEVLPDIDAFTDGLWYIRVRSSDPQARSAYDISTRHTGPGDCVDDGYEDNDAVLDGTDLADVDGVGVNGEVPDSDDGIEVPSPGEDPLQICRFDDDYYCLDLAAGDRFEAWAQSDAVAGQVRVRIVDSDDRIVGAEGLLVGEFANPVPAEVLGAVQGRHCVIVDGQGAAQGPYRLWIRRAAGPALCAQDPELVDGANDTAETATPLVDIEADRAPNQRFAYRNARLCGDEDDWYTFDVVEQRSRVCVMVDGFRHDTANIDIALFRMGADGEACAGAADCEPGAQCIGRVCQAALASSNSPFDAEQIDVSKRVIGDEIGEYKLRVFRGADGQDAAYRILATVTPEADVCRPDWQERAAGANENADRAINLGQGQASLCDTWLCHEGDEDNYRFTVPAGQDRTVFIEYANQDGAGVFMEISGNELNADPDFGGFRRSANAGDHQCINLRGGAQNQEVIVRLFGNLALPNGDDRLDYSLRIVPTDLGGLIPGNPQARFEQGECMNLGGADLGSCGFDNPFARRCWPHMDLE